MANLQVIDYTEKAIVVTGDTYEIKDQLKANGGKFGRSWKCGPGWMFPKSKINAIEAILSGFSGVDVANNAKGQKVAEKANEELPGYFLTKEEIRQFWAKGENPGKYLDFLCKRHPLGVRLTDGRVIFCERQEIETSFCFGYGYNGVSYEGDDDDAIKAQHKANTDESYFINENMKGIREKVREAKGEEKNPGYGLRGSKYCYTLRNERTNENYVYFYDVTKETLKNCYGCGDIWLTQAQIEQLEIVEGEDRERIVKLYEAEEAHRFKRVQTYLKKYGLSKLNTWTYLRD